MFIACDMTGWYQSRDGGESWRNINLKGVVRCAAFDPKRRKVIYAGGSGLYRSEDLGKTWRLVFPAPEKVTAEVEAHDHADHRYESADNWPGGLVLGIAVDPEQSDRIYLAIYRQAGQLGELLIFTSGDYGRSFEQLARIEGIDPRGAVGDNHAVRVLHIDVVSNPGAPALAPRADSPPDGRQLYLAAPGGLYRIALGGAVEALPLPEGVSTIDRAAVGRDRSSGCPVFYITAPARWKDSATLIGGVYRSDDRGRTWRQVHTGLLEGLYRPGESPPLQFTCIVVAAGDADVAYVECRNHRERSDQEAVWGHPFGVFKTTDGGRSWSWCYRAAWDERALNVARECWITRWQGPGYGGTAIDLAVAPSDPQAVWRVTAMCSFRSTDGGKTWQEMCSRWRRDGSAATNGMDVTTTYGVHFDPHVPRRMFITYTDIGLWLSQDGGKGWWLSRGGIPLSWRNTCYWMVFDPDVRDRMWSVWSGCHDLPRPKMFGGDWSARAGGVAFSGDGGRTWHPTTTGMPDNAVPTHILLDESNSPGPPGARRLYVAAFNHGVYRSDNDGRSWRLCNNGIDPTNLYAWRLALAADGTLYLCVARGGRDDGPYVDGAVYRSGDRGESWQRLQMPPGTNAPNDLAVDPRDPKRLYLACWPRTVEGMPAGGGLWGSRDGGRTWKLLLDEKLHCYAVTVHPTKPDRLYVCGFNSSIFRSDDRGASWRRLGGYNFKWGHRVIPDPHHPDKIYVTTFGGSVFHGPADGLPARRRGTGEPFEDIVPLRR